MMTALITKLKALYPDLSINGGYGVKDVSKQVVGEKEYIFVNYLGQTPNEYYTQDFMLERAVNIEFCVYSDPLAFIDGLIDNLKLDGYHFTFVGGKPLNETTMKRELHRFITIWEIQ